MDINIATFALLNISINHPKSPPSKVGGKYP
jgi:hypothetical protein